LFSDINGVPTSICQFSKLTIAIFDALTTKNEVSLPDLIRVSRVSMPVGYQIVDVLVDVNLLRYVEGQVGEQVAFHTPTKKAHGKVQGREKKLKL
jgi:hypothetical protein